MLSQAQPTTSVPVKYEILNTGQKNICSQQTAERRYCLTARTENAILMTQGLRKSHRRTVGVHGELVSSKSLTEDKILSEQKSQPSAILRHINL